MGLGLARSIGIHCARSRSIITWSPGRGLDPPGSITHSRSCAGRALSLGRNGTATYLCNHCEMYMTAGVQVSPKTGHATYGSLHSHANEPNASSRLGLHRSSAALDPSEASERTPHRPARIDMSNMTGTSFPPERPNGAWREGHPHVALNKREQRRTPKCSAARQDGPKPRPIHCFCTASRDMYAPLNLVLLSLVRPFSCRVTGPHSGRHLIQ